MTGREALLQAFDRLFNAAAEKLKITCTPEERAEAKASFVQRLGQALDKASLVEMPELPDAVVREMESAIGELSLADIAGVIATVPLAQQTQEMLRVLAFRQAEQRLLEHFAMQADTRFGGN